MRKPYYWIIAFAALLPSLASPAIAQPMRCNMATTDACGARGCARRAPVTWVEWDEAANSYRRCDAKGCDTYTPNVRRSGEITNISMPQNAMLARLFPGGGFLEIVTLVDVALISRGQCVAK
jgi:hypothetical protein